MLSNSFNPRFGLGDVVAFNTSPFIRNNVYVNVLLAAKKDNQPLMVVKEVSINTKSENLFDSSTGVQIAEPIKYTCVWFDAEKDKFNEACFYESFLVKVDIVTKVIDIKKVKLSSNFKFKTHSLEGIKFYSDSLLSSSPQLKPINTFLAPTFSFRGIKNIDNSTIEENGVKIKETSSKLVKVMWYNSSQNKFSEELVPIDCLELVSNEIESVEFQKLDDDESLTIVEGEPYKNGIDSYRLFLEKAGELLGIPDQQEVDFSSKRKIGKFVENGIFRTIDTEFKVFFSEGADWLKRYMDNNNLNVEKRKLFIKDDGDVKLYGQVDLLLKKEGTGEYWLVDIIGGYLTVEKDEKGKEFEDTNAGKKYLKRLELFETAIRKYSGFKKVTIKRVVLLISPFRCCELYHN